MSFPFSTQTMSSMTRLFLTAITLAAMANMMSGCVPYKQMPITEPESTSRGKIVSITLRVEIEGYTSTADEEFLFDSDGGIFDDKSKTISGVLEEGTTSSISLDDVEWVRLKEGTPEGPVSHLVDRNVFLSRAALKPWKSSGVASVQEGETVTFNKEGGIYDSTAHIITGITKEDKSVEIDAHDVYLVRSWKFQPHFIVLGLAGVVAGGILWWKFMAEVEAF